MYQIEKKAQQKIGELLDDIYRTLGKHPHISDE